MRRVFETAAILIGTLGWWGFVYPELCVTWETCQEEEASDSGILLEDFTEDIPGIFAGNASGAVMRRSGTICIKSKVIEYLYEEKEKGFRK